MSWFRKSQPKDERPPLQGYGDNLQGSTGEETQGGQSNRALLRLMKSVEERLPPEPRVDPDLIGDYYL